MSKNKDLIPTIIPSWMGESTLVGPFRTPQSFTLISAEHLLSKLRWDRERLEAMQWDESLGKSWRQAVSYKAIDCATSSWHLNDWFAQDIRGTQPRQRACVFLGIEGHDPTREIPLSVLRQKASAKCPDLDICRIIVNASKHYEVDNRPRPEIRTSCELTLATRAHEKFKRPYMRLSVFDGEIRRDLLEILTNCLGFWEELAAAARPKSETKLGVHEGETAK